MSPEEIQGIAWMVLLAILVLLALLGWALDARRKRREDNPRSTVLTRNASPLGMAVWVAHHDTVRLQDAITMGSPEDIEHGAITVARSSERLVRVMREQEQDHGTD